MARPKKNTRAGRLANERWQKTMAAKYGSVHDQMAKIGRKGGQNGKGPNYKGGFAGDHELAKRAGRKGGKISKRGPAKKGPETIAKPVKKVAKKPVKKVIKTDQEIFDGLAEGLGWLSRRKLKRAFKREGRQVK